MIVSNMYSVNDKSIYDAIRQAKVTNRHLVDLFLKHGVIISTDTSRDELALLFSRLYHSFSDYNALADIFGSVSRRERMTFSRLDASSITEDQLRDVLRNLNPHIEDIDQSRSSLLATNYGFRLEIKYKDVNFNKSEFRQVLDKEAEIEFHQKGMGPNVITVRYPDNKTCQRIIHEILEQINADRPEDEKVSRNNISLYGITDPKTRSLFFDKLINTVEETKVDDVTSVHVYQPDVTEIEFDEESAEGESEVGAGVTKSVHISKASLSGVGVANSQELSELHAKGYYIWKMIWRATSGTSDSDLYEIECQFSDAENFSGFSYLVRGLYSYLGDGKHSKNRIKCSSDIEAVFSERIENAANKVVEELENSVKLKGASHEAEVSHRQPA